MSDLRLPKDAASPRELWQYYETRSRQMLHEGYAWSGVIEWAPGFFNQAIRTFFHSESGRRWVSFFVVPSARGKGVMRRLATASPDPIVTLDDCELAPILKHLGVPHRVVGTQLLESVEYKLVQEFYGDQKAQRSQVFLMNHIDEGLAVMCWAGCSMQAARAFCLHPLLQNDNDLADNYVNVTGALRSVRDGAETIALAMEYRSVANEYLAHHAWPAAGIRLSPLPEVQQMLVGDKVQNRKDFELHHAGTHANSARLAEYFKQWCAALGVDERAYGRFKARLPGKTEPQRELGQGSA